MSEIDKLRAAGLDVQTVGEILDGMVAEDATSKEPHFISPDGKPHIKIYDQLEQGSAQWFRVRSGLLTASEMKLIVTPTLKYAANDKVRTHLYELLAQRVTRFVEPQFEGFDMLRGREEEIEARQLYGEKYAAVQEVGFITNSRWGFTLGMSPDGLVGSDGMIEVKSRKQKYQFQTYVECLATGTIPAEYLIQVQTALLVSEREWCDFISFSNGLPMVAIKVFPDPAITAAIVEAATAFEAQLAAKHAEFEAAIQPPARIIPTQRKIEVEMY